MHRLVALALLAAITIPAVAQDDGPGKTETEGQLENACKLITADSLKKHLMEIASDEYEGRNAGYPGNDKVTEYIAKHFKAIGLKPVGDDDTYFQAFTFSGRGTRKRLKTRNCVGFYEGSDETLKEEIVVIGAHHDHVGRAGQADAGRMKSRRADPDDDIWNGADDNGSGTTTVLEIARAFMEGKIKTKRSVLFMTFSAEEHGLIGSAHYCSKPIFERKRHVAMINLDMVGRNPDKAMSVGGTGTSRMWEDLIDAASKEADCEVKTSASVSGGSDHASFAQKRIPAVHLFTGFHADYHRQTDHPEKIAYDRMSKIGRFGLRLLVKVADLKDRPKFTGDSRRLLGITGADIDEDEADAIGLDSDQGGIRIDTISTGSAAEEAGVKKGDIILSLGGKTIPRERGLAVLRRAIRDAKANKKVELIVMRNEEKKTLWLIWEE